MPTRSSLSLGGARRWRAGGNFHRRARLTETFASPKGIFLFDDVSYPKQGRYSVGVQRERRQGADQSL